MTAEQPIHDGELEKRVLATFLLVDENRDSLASMLEPHHFYAPRHGVVWRILLDLHRRNEAIDTATLVGVLQRAGQLAGAGGVEFVLSLSDSLPESASAVRHAMTLRQLATLRALTATCHAVCAEAREPGTDIGTKLEDLRSRLFTAIEQQTPVDSMVALDQATAKALTLAMAARDKGVRTCGQSTGFAPLDRVVAGMRGGELFILAARPAMGKSALALNMALAVAASGTPVLFVSLEMSTQQVAERAIASLSSVPNSLIRSAGFTDEHLKLLCAAQARLEGLPFYIDDAAALTLNDLRAKARRVRRKYGRLGLIVVDYLTLMRSSSRRAVREQEVAEMSRDLKTLALQMDTPVLALAQLNRQPEARIDKRPMLSDLRESGAIEQDADCVIFLYRDEVYNAASVDRGVAELIVAKQRNGPTGTVRLSYANEYLRFGEIGAGCALGPFHGARLPMSSNGRM